MRPVLLNLAVSLDGFIEDAAGRFDWCFTDQDYGMTDFLARIDAILMGRKSYELLISMGEDPFPQPKKYVFSNTLNAVNDPYLLIRGDAAEMVRSMKAEPGKAMWLFGGAQFNQAIANAGLVDEYILSVHPILLGSGKPVFTGLNTRIPLRLLRAETYSSGLVQLSYCPE